MRWFLFLWRVTTTRVLKGARLGNWCELRCNARRNTKRWKAEKGTISQRGREGEKPSKLETAREPLFSFMHSFILAVCYQTWIVAETVICHGRRIGRFFWQTSNIIQVIFQILRSVALSDQSANALLVSPKALTSSATKLLWVPIARTSIFLPSLPSFLTVQFRGPPVPHLIHSLTHPLHLTALCTYPWPWRRPAPPWPSPRTPSLEEQIERRCMHDCLRENPWITAVI